eukprot:jgi/Mesvir1/10873/Mv14213-RA.1
MVAKKFAQDVTYLAGAQVNVVATVGRVLDYVVVASAQYPWRLAGNFFVGDVGLNLGPVNGSFTDIFYISAKLPAVTMTMTFAFLGVSLEHMVFLVIATVVTNTSQAGRKESVLDLAKFVDKGVCVKLTGGRQVQGLLKGYDQLLNLVLDEATETLRDPDDALKLLNETRHLGLIVCRGPSVMLVSPTDGTDEIANPFVGQDS